MSNGNRHTMYYVPEASYGVTPLTPAFKYLRHNTATLAQAKNTLQSAEIRPNRQIVDFRMGTGQAGGNVVSELAYGDFDDALEALFMGTWTDDVLKIGNTRRSFSMLRRFEDMDAAAPNNKKVQRFYGMEFNTMDLQVTTEAIVQMTMGMVGKGMELSATNPVGATIGNPGTNLAMDSFTGVITENGVDIAVITEIALKLENGIEPRYVVGSRDSIRPSSQKATVTGTITAFFEDSYLLEKFINEETSDIEFTLMDGINGNGLKFSIPRVKYTGGQTDVSGDGAITIPMPFQATYDPTTDTTLSITRIPKA